MPFPAFDRFSPHWSSEPPHERRGVLFHHSVKSFVDTVAFMTHPDNRVSYHVLIDADGTRCTLVPDEKVAWHAGISTFQGRSGCNAFLLGLAFAGDTYLAPLTEAQLASAREWLEARWRRYQWTTAWMTDHRQAAPGRKDDLNPVEWLRVQTMLATFA